MQTATNEVITSTFTTQRSTGPQRRFNGGIIITQGAWVDGLPLVLSVALGGPVPVSTITLGGLVVLGGPDGANFADLVAAPNDELVINIDLSEASDLVCGKFAGMYLAASVTIDASGASFSGSVTSTCQDGAKAVDYAWTGRSMELAPPEHLPPVMRRQD